NDLASFTPPWASDGGTEKLLQRLKDPVMRAKIRQDILTPSDKWDNGWVEVDGPQDILITSVHKKELLRYQGKRISDIAAEWRADPLDAILDFIIKDEAGTGIAAFGMREPDVVAALQQSWVSVGTDDGAASPEGILGAD